MALQSPGIQVTVVDESFYTPAEPGTTPLIVIATAQNKMNAAGTGTAMGTTAANAGKAFKMTSQRDLLDIFGVPFFEKTASSSPIHGGERNEYGMLAAYSLLGISNAAFIVRANIDLDQLEAQGSAPGANPSDGAWWVDTQTSSWGIQVWNSSPASTTGGQKFATKMPIVLTDDDAAKIAPSGAPQLSVGSIGDYAVVFQTVLGTSTFVAAAEQATIWYKSVGNTQAGIAAGEWVLVGSNGWAASHPAVVGGTVTNVLVNTDSLIINGTTVASIGTTLTSLVTRINSLSITGVTAKEVSSKLYLYTSASNDGPDAGGTIPGDSTLSNSITIAAGSGTVLTSIGIVAGTYYGPSFVGTPHTQVPEWKTSDLLPRPTGSVWIKTTEPNQGARLRIKRWDTATLSWVAHEAPMYSSSSAALYYLDRSGGGAKIPVNSLYTQVNSEENAGYDLSPATATFRVWRRAALDSTTIRSTFITTGTLGSSGVKTFSIAETIKNQVALATAKLISFTAVNTSADAILMAGAINAAGFANLEAAVTVDNELEIFHKLGGDFRLIDGTGSPIAATYTPFNINTFDGTSNFYELPDAAHEDYVASNWQPFAASNFKATAHAPLNEPIDGQIWYDPVFAEVDIMVHNGKTWVGYRSLTAPHYNALRRDIGPSVSASNPYAAGITVTGDLWISTADLENYPSIYRYDALLQGAASEKWTLIDKTDQLTEEGIVFADARYGTSGLTGNTAASIGDLLVSNYLDTDAPDPALYPKGMLLWNLRRSGGNVKRYHNNYVQISSDNERYDSTNSPNGLVFVAGEGQSAYATDRWVTASPNNEDGSGSFGRHAQRSVVVAAMKSVVDTSQEIRDEERRNFNLIAAPGYPELLSNLVNLNIDRGITSFVIGDTPLRLQSDATSLTNWGSNANLVTDNGDLGIVTYDEYCAVFYPNGFTTDLSGSNAVVPASHMMLKTVALSDNVSYPWFAPAGTRRGGITNATAVGYIDATSGEFHTVALNEGQRDTLYDLKINPITFFNGIGLINFGQKTRARNASALDRINVSRLTVYLRSQLNKLARPYIFEPNDKITRDEVKQACESLLLELVGLRALYDFAVICDETNNTPTRVDRNELWVDIAIEPVKAVEFIYIPLRVKNTGEI